VVGFISFLVAAILKASGLTLIGGTVLLLLGVLGVQVGARHKLRALRYSIVLIIVRTYNKYLPLLLLMLVIIVFQVLVVFIYHGDTSVKNALEGGFLGHLVVLG
jgi:hypothetical protein